MLMRDTLASALQFLFGTASALFHTPLPLASLLPCLLCLHFLSAGLPAPPCVPLTLPCRDNRLCRSAARRPAGASAGRHCNTLVRCSTENTDHRSSRGLWGRAVLQGLRGGTGPPPNAPVLGGLQIPLRVACMAVLQYRGGILRHAYAGRVMEAISSNAAYVQF